MSRLLLGLLVVLSTLLVGSRLSGSGGTEAAPRPPQGTPHAVPSDTVTVEVTESTFRPEPVAVPEVEAPPSTPTIERLARLEARRRLFQSGRYTYVDSVFTTSDSVVRRWLPQPNVPIRVAMTLPDSLGLHQTRALRAIQTALGRWSGLPIGIVFQVVRDSSRADILVRWIDRFDTDRSGQADIQFGSDGVIREAQVILALHGADGRPLDDGQLRIVATHEVGHALGLPHSARPTDVMYPTAQRDGLSPRDRATAVLIYSVLPGSMAEPETP